MSRKNRPNVTEIEETVEAAPRAHSLATWLENADAELDAERARQLEFSHREGTLAQVVQEHGAPLRPNAYGAIERWPEGERERKAARDELGELDDFLALGILAPLAVEATRHAKLDVGEAAMRAAAERAEAAKRGGLPSDKAPRTIAQPLRPRNDDPRVRFSGELEALRALAMSGWKTRAGDLERLRHRLLLGSTVQGSVVPREPIPDPYLEATGKALAMLDPTDAEMLVATYIELQPPRNRLGEVCASASAQSIAAKVREGEGELPPWSKLRKGAHITAPLLVAERFGRIDPEDEEQQATVAKEVAGRVSRARKAFRRALQGFDFHPEPEPRENEAPEAFRARVEEWSRELKSGPRWIVPPATTRERATDRDIGRATVDCCGGAPIENGVRSECSLIHVSGPAGDLHQSNAWPICDYCKLPQVMGATG